MSAEVRQRDTIPVFGRYLLVGAFNTGFGYACFALFTRALTRLPYGYVLASVLANLVAITVAFLGYKWFVFRTKGNYVREWIRCVAVYSTTIVLSAAALPLLVTLVRRISSYDKGAPYIAGAIVIGVTPIISFFGHKHISFRGGRRAEAVGSANDAASGTDAQVHVDDRA